MYIDDESPVSEKVMCVAKDIAEVDRVLKAVTDPDYMIVVKCQDDLVCIDDSDDAHPKIIRALKAHRRERVGLLHSFVGDV